MLKYFLTLFYPLNGLRFIDTFPLFLLLHSISAKFKKEYFIYSIFFIATFAILYIYALDNSSLIRYLSHILIFFLLPIYRHNHIDINIEKILKFFLFIALLEQVLINFGIYSPLSRDPGGSLFIFREKSYAGLFILFSLTLGSNKVQLNEIFLLIALFIVLPSSIILLSILFLVYSYVVGRNMFWMILPFLVIFIAYFALIQYKFSFWNIEYTDFLRFLINGSVIASEKFGSLYIHNLDLYNNDFINLNSQYFYEWENLVPQGIFFSLYALFGVFGILICLVELYLLSKSRFFYGERYLVYVCFIILMYFIQGFLFNPYIIYYLSSYDEKRNI